VTGERDHEGRRRSGVWLPDECWDWLDANKAEGLTRSDLMEGLVLLAMDAAGPASGSTRDRHPTAEALRHIADDLRAAGDIPLVHLRDDGVARAGITLADEMWLLAVDLDGHWDAAGGDGDGRPPRCR
jgi:hypothetical protein